MFNIAIPIFSECDATILNVGKSGDYSCLLKVCE